MSHRYPDRVPDYTTANLALLLVNLLWVFGVVWTYYGLGAVIMLALLLNYGITRLAHCRARRAAQSIRRGKRGYEEA